MSQTNPGLLLQVPHFLFHLDHLLGTESRHFLGLGLKHEHVTRGRCQQRPCIRDRDIVGTDHQFHALDLPRSFDF